MRGLSDTSALRKEKNVSLGIAAKIVKGKEEMKQESLCCTFLLLKYYVQYINYINVLAGNQE